MQISSPSNQTIKDLVRLKDRKGERAGVSFVVEGRREIERALAAHFIPEELYYCPEEIDSASSRLIKNFRFGKIIEVSKPAFAKVATREGSDGILAVFAIRSVTTEDVLQRAGGDELFLIVMENVEKPGNLGAVLRTADAVGVHGVILLGANVDNWNPNVIRASLGGVFSIPVIHMGSDHFFEFCQAHKINIVAAALTPTSQSLFAANLSGPVSIILGSEARGISPEILARVEQRVVIPMNGLCDSLNVSVAAGVMAYESLRQRQSAKNFTGSH